MNRRSQTRQIGGVVATWRSYRAETRRSKDLDEWAYALMARSQADREQAERNRKGLDAWHDQLHRNEQTLREWSQALYATAQRLDALATSLGVTAELTAEISRLEHPSNQPLLPAPDHQEDQ